MPCTEPSFFPYSRDIYVPTSELKKEEIGKQFTYQISEFFANPGGGEGDWPLNPDAGEAKGEKNSETLYLHVSTNRVGTSREVPYINVLT